MRRLFTTLCIAMSMALFISFSADAQKRRTGKARTTTTTNATAAKMSTGLTFRTFTMRSKEPGFGFYQSRLSDEVVVKNLKSLGFALTGQKTETREDYTGTEYYDVVIKTFSKTINGQTTDVLLEEGYTEITFPNSADAQIFFASAKAAGLRKSGNTQLEDNPKIYWTGTNVEIKGNVVTLSYGCEP